jgi:lysophospholipase L1-like esterase
MASDTRGRGLERERRTRGINVTIAAAGMLLTLAVIIILFVWLSDDGSDGDGARHVYLSLGDSIAAGNGATDSSSTSFAGLIAAQEDVDLRNLAEAGATSQQVIDEQVPDALPLLRSRQVRFITISAGGNDLAALIPNPRCIEDPPPASCPLDQTLDGVAARIDQIVRQLQEADAGVPIVLLGYPNLFSGTGHPWDAPAGRVLAQLNQRLKDVTSAYEDVALAEPSFEEHAGDLTHVLDPVFDPHPNDAGHRLIADAMLAALQDLR